MEAIAPYSLPRHGLGQRKAILDLGHVDMERCVETGHLRHVRKGLAKSA